MLQTIKNYMYLRFFSDVVGIREQKYIELLDLRTEQLKQCDKYHETKMKDLEQRLNTCAEMLANKNAQAVQAQQLYVTNHAVHRYRERIGFNGSNEELRTMIYKQTIKHMATLDKLNGHYKINDKAAVRVEDNTVQTVVKAKWKKQS